MLSLETGLKLRSTVSVAAGTSLKCGARLRVLRLGLFSGL